MLFQAMNQFQVAKREYSEASKAQYTDKGDVKNYFRASELGNGDRKLLYSFFKHQIPTTPKSPKNLRQLENGDFVHQRYQKAWEDMGILVSMEERLSSKDDEYLSQFPWEWAGHYDGELDLNVIKAHALGLCTIGYSKNEDTDQWEMEVDVDDEYANSIGLFQEDYVPLSMIADIKTMNPWGFDRLAKGNVSEISGYIDQISFYMYMKNTPYGSIFVENKATNDTIEIQIVWTDMHDGVTYTFDPELHGEAVEGVVRITINNDRFFGSETEQGLVPRVSHLWEVKELLEKADAEGDLAKLAEVMPPRCSEEPGKFPCSWSNGKEKCEYFDHCWNPLTNGCAVRKFEACPEECKRDIVDSVSGEYWTIDTRKLPAGATPEALQALYNMGAIKVENLQNFLVDAEPAPIKDVIDEAENADTILGANGELHLGAPVHVPAKAEDAEPSEGDNAEGGDAEPVGTKGTEALEYKNKNGKKAIKCLNCGRENTYEKLANGGTKKCQFCNHVNKVVRM